MGRFIFLDIDGTLAYPGQAPTAATIAAIKQVRQNGHKVFISTGRTMDSIPPAIADIGFDGGIFSSGAIVSSDNKIVLQHFMHNTVVQKILSSMHQNNVFYTLETADGRFNTENGNDLLSRIDLSVTSKEMRNLTTTVLFDPTALPMSHYAGQPIHKITYYSADLNITLKIQTELNMVAKVVPFHNIPGFPLATGEISDYAINKGCALKDLCEHLGVLPSDCIAFGDSMNDIEILDAAGLGIAMGNAEVQLKRTAAMVCDSCENDGIAKALHALKLI